MKTLLNSIVRRATRAMQTAAVAVITMAASVIMATAPASQAQTFDPSDPYRMLFLDQLIAMADVATPISLEWAKIRSKGGSAADLDLSELQRLNLELQQELQNCGDDVRREIEAVAIGMLEASFNRPDRMIQLSYMLQLIDAGYRTDIDAINRLAGLLNDDFLLLEDINGDGRRSNGEPVPPMLLNQAGRLLYEKGFFRSILAIGDALIDRGALPTFWREFYYPRAMFFMGEVDRLWAYSEQNDINLIDDWLLTTALRAGEEAEALAIQERIDQDDPDNLTRMLFFESAGAREAHCGNIMQAIRDNDATNQQEEEADGGRDWFGSWRMLLCGEFADSRRAALKTTWAHRQGRCSAVRSNVNMTNLYNGILSGVYQAAELRVAGATEQSTELLDTVVAEVRQALFLDSFSGYSNLEIVIEDDIAIYMSRLHGERPELSLVKGMLERGRGEFEAARADFQQALRLSGVGPQDQIDADLDQTDGLDVKWLLQLTEWIDELDAQLVDEG